MAVISMFYGLIIFNVLYRMGQRVPSVFGFMLICLLK